MNGPEVAAVFVAIWLVLVGIALWLTAPARRRLREKREAFERRVLRVGASSGGESVFGVWAEVQPYVDRWVRQGQSVKIRKDAQ